MADNDVTTIFAVGDVCVDREDPDSIFEFVAPTIQSADAAFCQLETTYSEKGFPLPQTRVPGRAHPKNAPSIKKAGFNVVSFASNHALDFGSEALFDTVDVMKKTGIDLFGVGKNIDEARKPHMINCKGTKIAFLTYNSILPIGYWATGDRPGCSPMRGYTLYEQVEHDQPGTPARIHSYANRDDKKAMVEDIQKAREQADIVIVSLHWGIHFTEGKIAMYQEEVGYAAIDAGAELILGHHAHILKPIEIYKGKPIFYSLGNFAFDAPYPEEVLNSPRWKELMELNPTWTIDPRYKAYPFPADSRMTMGCRITLSGKQVKRIAFLPAIINEDSQPRFLDHNEKEFQDLVNYMEKITKAQNMNTVYSIEGDEVVIGT